MQALSPNDSRTEEFYSRLSGNIIRKELVRLVLGSSRQPETNLKNLIIKPVELKSGFHLQFVYRYPSRDITRNYTEQEALSMIREAMDQSFYHADLFTVKDTIQYSINTKGKTTLSIRGNQKPLQPDFLHDQVKKRLVETTGNSYLRDLGVLNAACEVRPEMSDKFLQINRYIEILQPWFETFTSVTPLKIVDMGSGKGYLTFALYDYLRKKGIETVMTGIEQRKELVELSGEIADKAGFIGLKFITGSIEKAVTDPPDVLIALHACDTATDEAIFRGLQWQAGLIVVAPCCHKQVRKNMKTTGALHPVLRHGILAERQAAIFTDAIRAMIMESYGYKTSVIEFIDSAHTPKNVMIIGRKTRTVETAKQKSLKQAETFMNNYGIDKHYLVQLLHNLTGETG